MNYQDIRGYGLEGIKNKLRDCPDVSSGFFRLGFLMGDISNMMRRVDPFYVLDRSLHYYLMIEYLKKFNDKFPNEESIATMLKSAIKESTMRW